MIELELHTPEEHKFWEGATDGTVLITRTGHVGMRGRTKTKEYLTECKAAQALDRAMNKRFKEGYFPIDGLPPYPVEMTDEDVAAVDDIRLKALKEKQFLSIRNRIPPQLMIHTREYGYHYVEGPGLSNLWLKPVKDGVMLYVARGHFIQPVQPVLKGDVWNSFPFNHHFYPPRPDSQALLVAHEQTLYELSIDSAQARPLADFASAEALREGWPFLYQPDGKGVLYRQGRKVMGLDTRTGEQKAIVTVKGTDTIDLALLDGGLLAVLQGETLSIWEPGDQGWVPRRNMFHRGGRSLGTWLQGRVLVLMSASQETPNRTVILGVHGGELYEMKRSERIYRKAFDYRDWQWLVQAAPGGDIDWVNHRAFNVEPVLARALETNKPLPEGYILERPSLIDAMAEAAGAREAANRLSRLTGGGFATIHGALAVKDMLAGGHDPNEREAARGCSPLHVAKSADVDRREDHGNTPLMLTAQEIMAGEGFFIRRVAQPAFPHGTRWAPDVVQRALKSSDWVQTSPAQLSFVLLYSKGQYKVAVGDEEGVHIIEPLLQARTFPYSFHPRGEAFLVSEGSEVLEVDILARRAAVVMGAKGLDGPVKEVGYVGDDLYVMTETTLRYLSRDKGILRECWSLGRGPVKEMMATGEAMVALALETGLIWAHLSREGLRRHSRAEGFSPVQLWSYREAGAPSRCFARTSWSDHDALFYEIVHPDAEARELPLAKGMAAHIKGCSELEPTPLVRELG